MSRVALLDPRESDDLELQAFGNRLPPKDGVGNHFKAETNFPEIMMAIYESRIAIARHREIGPELFDKIAIAISMENDCRHCTGAFCSGLSGRLGGEEAAREYQIALAREELEGKERDFVKFALKIYRNPHALTEDEFEYLREEYNLSDRGFIGLIYTVNIVSGYNRVTVGLDLPYDIPYPKEWAVPDSVP